MWTMRFSEEANEAGVHGDVRCGGQKKVELGSENKINVRGHEYRGVEPEGKIWTDKGVGMVRGGTRKVNETRSAN
jgi:hypothetical protein